MKQLLLLVSLVLFSFFPPIDNPQEQIYISGIRNNQNLSFPDYLPIKHDINGTTGINKPDASKRDPGKDWYSEAIKNIRQEEYNIIYSVEARAYQSLNRANNILFTYYNNGFNAKTLQTNIPLSDMNDKNLREEDKKYKYAEDWSIELRIKNYESGINNSKMASAGNKAWIKNDKLRIEYANSDEGMRQNFVIKERPLHELSLQIKASTKLKMSVNKSSVTFCSKDGTEKMKYSSLKVWDAEGKELAANFEKQSSGRFAIRVDDRDAVYPVTIDPLSSTPDWVKGGSDYGDEFGYSVADAGDLNRDGYSDVIIGSPNYWLNHSGAGRASVFYGSPSGLSTNAGWTFDGPDANAKFGYSVSGAGDVNGDNYDDVIIGAPYYSNGQTKEGKIYVFFGTNTGLKSSPDWVYESNKEFAYAGYSVSKAGDINNDGYADVMIGAPGYGNDFFNAQGRVFIFKGSVSGLSSSPDDTFKNMLDGYTGMGLCVSYAGDINNDGYSDILFGEPYWPPPPSLGSASTLESQGRVMIAYGSLSGVQSTSSLTGEVSHSLFGFSVSCAGDVNGDGYSDIVIGSPYFHSEYCETSGKVYVYNGTASGISSAPDWSKDCSNMGYTSRTEGFGSSVSGTDINNDGFSDIIIGAHFTDWDMIGDTTLSAAYVYYGSSEGLPWSEGWYYELPGTKFITVSGLKDVNGDGYGEVILGAKNNSFFPTSNARVFYGGNVITGLLPDWQADSESEIYHFGYSVSGGGDFNNDGYDDVIIGAPVSDPNGTGKVWIYYGSQSGLPDHRQMYLSGTGGFGSAVAVAGDVNNDGYDDAIISAPSTDNGGSSGKVYLYLGSAGGLLYAPAWTCTALGPGGNFGNSLSSAGDVNADGYSDIVIGNFGNQIYNSHNVGAYIFCGSPSGIVGNIPAWTASVPSNILIDGFGRSVSSAGDVNGDNFDDVIIGTFPSESFSGKAFVYFGQPGRAMFAPEDWSASGDSLFGYSVSGAGDVNKDGFDDIIISEMLSDEFNGRVYLYLGSPVGPSILPDWSTAGYLASLFGSSLSSAGDYNGDGYSDFAVAEYHGMGSYIFFGSNSLPGGTADVILRNSAMSLSSAGDVNGDGYDDVISGRGISVWTYYGRANSFHIYPKRSVVLVSEECCVNTVVTTPSGKPMTGIGVSFIIKGVNHDSDYIITNNNGIAQFCYSGHNPGFDTIISQSGMLADTSIITRDFPTPVELAFFSSSVSGRDISLNWTTSSEVNNSGFDIERSNVKGQISNEWSKVGFVQGNGNSSTNKNYEFTEKGLNTGKYEYRLRQIDFNGNFKYYELSDEVSIGIPNKYELSQNYPNPFNPVTTINYDIPKDGIVTIKLYDILGREMKILVNEMKTAGYYKIHFNAGDLSSGVYFYSMIAENFVTVKKLVVLK